MALEKAGWKCSICKDGTQELHVHHSYYDGNPWDVPLESLTVLCSDCHQLIHTPIEKVIVFMSSIGLKPMTRVERQHLAAYMQVLTDMLYDNVVPMEYVERVHALTHPIAPAPSNARTGESVTT